jgi:hypothetical protein
VTPEQVRDLIKRGEGQAIEFKESFAQQNPAVESLCAFANAQGGSVIFGVTDEGSITHLALGVRTLENFANILRANTDPPLTPSINVTEVDGKQVVSAIVPAPRPGELFYAFNRPFIRVGKTNQVMPPGEQRARLLAANQGDLRMVVRIHDHRFAGDNLSVIVLTVSVENLAARHAFVDYFEVVVDKPFHDAARPYEYRDGHLEHISRYLPLNIPPGGVSERLKLLVRFDNGFRSRSGVFSVKVAAVGPMDFEPMHTKLAAVVEELKATAS